MALTGQGFALSALILSVYFSPTQFFKPDLTIVSSPYEDDDNLIDLHVVGLISFTQDYWPSGEALFPAVKWALEDIGQKPDVLPGYRLVMTIIDSGVSTFRGCTLIFYHGHYVGPLTL